MRASIGHDAVLSLRLCCDELAPWAGVTPEHAAEQVARLADLVDLVVVVRGGPFSASAYRPDAHTPPGFNLDLCRRMREAAAGRAAVVLQGSVVDPATAQAALDDGSSRPGGDDQGPDRRAPVWWRWSVTAGADGYARASCATRPAGFGTTAIPLVSCVGEPRSGHETVEPPVEGVDDRPRPGR